MKIYKKGDSYAIETNADCPEELAKQWGEAISRVINNPDETYGEQWASELAALLPYMVTLHEYLAKGNLGNISYCELFAKDDILTCGNPAIAKKKYWF